MKVRADFHIHSCLSPCGDLAMAPKDLVLRGKEAGLDVMALTDHNAAFNCPAFRDACTSAGIYPLYGMEVTTVEELHCLVIFGRVEEALDLGRVVMSRYSGPPNDPEKWGDQVYLDGEENILGEVDVNLTQGATDISLTELGSLARDRGGLFIPAHIDRPYASVFSQLGFLPPDSYTALEVTGRVPQMDRGNYPLTASSDAHFLDDIGRRRTILEIGELSFHGISKALALGKTECLGLI